MVLKDKFGRQITDLRVSVTDRCNFRCIYCRAAEPENCFPSDELLTWPELARLCRLLAGLGIRKVRVTGGEPLARAGIEAFIEYLAGLGLQDLSLTTNGFSLAARAQGLKAAGLPRINISLGSLQAEKFDRITRTRGALPQVLVGIEAAAAAGFNPIRLNAVIVRGFNDDEILDFVQFARAHSLAMRFIEFMPLDADRIWDWSRVVTAREILAQLRQLGELVELPRQPQSGTALRYRFSDNRTEIGLVASVSRPFCGQCSRLRLTADGKIRTCLFSLAEHDIRSLVRNGASDGELAATIARIVAEKEAGHRINQPDFVLPNRTMGFIGG